MRDIPTYHRLVAMSKPLNDESAVTVKEILDYATKFDLTLVDLDDNRPIDIIKHDECLHPEIGHSIDLVTAKETHTTTENIHIFINCATGSLRHAFCTSTETRWGLVRWAKDIPDVRDGTMIQHRTYSPDSIRRALKA